jgi:hypothetical protein
VQGALSKGKFNFPSTSRRISYFYITFQNFAKISLFLILFLLIFPYFLSTIFSFLLFLKNSSHSFSSFFYDANLLIFLSLPFCITFSPTFASHPYKRKGFLVDHNNTLKVGNIPMCSRKDGFGGGGDRRGAPPKVG